MSLLFNTQPKNAASFYNGIATTSVRFEDGDTPFLAYTPGSAGDRRKWVWAAWIKRGNLGVGDATLFGSVNAGTSQTTINIENAGTILVSSSGGSSAVIGIRSTTLLRDTNAWYHLAVAVDTTQATAANRVLVYLNGSQVTEFTAANYPAENSQTTVNEARALEIGRYNQSGVNQEFDGYLAEVNFTEGVSFFSDTSATANSSFNINSFGEAKNGVWIPINTGGLTFGDNGFRLQFKQVGVGTASTSTIGADTSGEANHLTSSGIVAVDCAMPDSPENNFNTFSPLIPFNSGTLTEGNLKSNNVIGGSSGHGPMSAFGVTSGKWFCEMYVHDIGGGDYVYAGAFLKRIDSNFRQGIDLAVPNDGSVYFEGAAAGSITGLEVSANGHIYGFAVDCDNFTAQVYKTVSGTYGTYGPEVDWSGAAHKNNGYMGIGHFGASGTSGRDGGITINYGQDPSFAGAITAGTETPSDGAGVFKLAPPSGFLAMCTANFAEPAIGANSDTQATGHFNTVIYTGDDNANRAVTGVGFKPDFLWHKSRNATNWHFLFDSNRGVGKRLSSNVNNVEGSASGLDSFDNNGFTVDHEASNQDMNASAHTYVAWNWKANGGTATATISESGNNPAAVVQANPTAGFSLITYTGTGATGTIAHGLSAVPKWMLIKNRDVADAWAVYHGALTAAPATDYIVISSAAATVDDATYWNDTAPTSSVFTVNTVHNVNANGEKYVAYVFAEVDGYSQFGGYTGNGSADGPMVFTGFSPAWVMIKCSSNGSTNWFILDNKRDVNNEVLQDLTANTSAEEADNSNFLDFLSNGFKLRTTGAAVNGAGRTMIYMAFAEAPFKYANAK